MTQAAATSFVRGSRGSFKLQTFYVYYRYLQVEAIHRFQRLPRPSPWHTHSPFNPPQLEDMATVSILRRPIARVSNLRLIKPYTTTRTVMDRKQVAFRSYFVTPDELDKSLKLNAPNKISTAPKTVPICGSWFLPNDPENRTGRQVFNQAHIPHARFFDLDKIADTSSPYPHMLPSSDVFTKAMSDLGINRDDTLVVYDTSELGIFSAPRVAWTLKIFGHPAVHILNNFRLWVEQGYPVEGGTQASFEATQYPESHVDKTKVVGFEEMKELVSDHNKEGAEPMQILDARPLGRWKGTDPEPRAGLPSGHMPGSLSLAFPELLNPKTKTLLPAQELRRVFKEKGVDPHKPIISSCGTGVTATVIDAALTEAGYGDGIRRIYDGSWTEWAQRVQPRDNLIVQSDR
ncbi:Hypothetical protein R9X50_00027000 [Acrodontium crateriforme]|uniref:Rhodanese domain-containing protein n=1 Tax=Acrodontium crateriforme TaxID=150365 RepID=A0AAQ3R4S9_9PEZI|nr:Hypothetical protein R9X50_00027000 [Acrodontium crateriforme]